MGVKSYTYAGAGVLASQVDGANAEFFRMDGRGSTAILTSSVGSTSASYEYGYFGNITEYSGPSESMFTFRSLGGVYSRLDFGFQMSGQKLLSYGTRGSSGFSSVLPGWRRPKRFSIPGVGTPINVDRLPGLPSYQDLIDLLGPGFGKPWSGFWEGINYPFIAPPLPIRPRPVPPPSCTTCGLPKPSPSLGGGRPGSDAKYPPIPGFGKELISDLFLVICLLSCGVDAAGAWLGADKIGIPDLSSKGPIELKNPFSPPGLSVPGPGLIDEAVKDELMSHPAVETFVNDTIGDSMAGKIYKRWLKVNGAVGKVTGPCKKIVCPVNCYFKWLENNAKLIGIEPWQLCNGHETDEECQACCDDKIDASQGVARVRCYNGCNFGGWIDPGDIFR